MNPLTKSVSKGGRGVNRNAITWLVICDTHRQGGLSIRHSY